MGSLTTNWGFPSRRSSKVSQKAFQSLRTDMSVVSSNVEAVLTRCINLVGSDDQNADEAEIDPMLGQPGPGAGKQ